MCWHPFSGFTGAILGPLVLAGIYAIPQRSGTYNINPQDKEGAFEPILARYIRGAEFIIGIASTSIVLLAGSSVFHGQSGHIPWVFATPLLLLAWSVVFGTAFMIWLNHCYEVHQHGAHYTAQSYSLTEALGFGSLICFVCGYVWLIFLVTQ